MLSEMSIAVHARIYSVVANTAVCAKFKREATPSEAPIGGTRPDSTPIVFIWTPPEPCRFNWGFVRSAVVIAAHPLQQETVFVTPRRQYPPDLPIAGARGEFLSLLSGPQG